MSKNCSCHGSGNTPSQTVAAVLERPRYSPGLILEDGDLTAAVNYTQSLNRLLFRNLFGCGVICGLNVSAVRDCGVLQVTVTAGLALDGCGDPIQVPGPVTVAIGKAKLAEMEKDPTKPGRFWVILCGREKPCAPRPLLCETDEYDGAAQPTRIRALSEVSIVFDPPDCACKCQEPKPREPDATGRTDDVHHTPCQYDHETRLDCAPDCGCGTACACGCCVLLAYVEGKPGKPPAPWAWTAKLKDVRRFIRPKLIVEPDPPKQPESDPQERPDTGRDYTRPNVEAPPAETSILDRLRAALDGLGPQARLSPRQALELVDTAVAGGGTGVAAEGPVADGTAGAAP